MQRMSDGHSLDRWTSQDSETSLVSEGGVSHRCSMDVYWTGGLDRTVGQAKGGISNGSPVDIHWTGRLDMTVGQPWSVRVGCPMDVPWTGRTILSGQRTLMANLEMSG